MPQSRSEPSLHGFDGQYEAKTAEYYIPIHLSKASSSGDRAPESDDDPGTSRGRSVHRPGSPQKALQDVNEDEVLEVKEVPSKRSRSPVKRLLGLGKSTSLKDIAGEPQAQAKEEPSDRGRRGGLKVWGDKLKHGFLVFESIKGTAITTTDDIADYRIKANYQAQPS